MRRAWACVKGARRAVFLAIGCAALIAVLAPSQASADFGVDEFEAGTCETSNEPTGQCTYDTPDRFFTQAAGHPPFGIIDFTFNTDSLGVPEGRVQNVRTDLPVGLSVNPQAVPKCTVDELEAPAGPACPADSQVGTNWITTLSSLIPAPIPVDVYNMVPPDGQPLMAGMRIAVPGVLDETVYLVGDVEWEGDYHQFFTISDIGDDLPIVRNRLVFEGTANDDGMGPDFIRMPTQCSDGETTDLAVASHANPDDFLHYSATTPVGVQGCENVPFGPEVDVATASDRTDSPTGVSVEVEVPEPSGDIQPSDVREVEMTLPEGMGLNASSVVGLGTCTEEQFGMGTREAIDCPASSRVGDAAIETPSLPEGSLAGDVYAGQPLSDDPASGEQFRLFVEAGSERYGVSIRLIGAVEVDPETGRLTTRFTDLPQAPFSSFTVDLDGGPRAVLSTPPTCGPHTTEARFVPWSGEGATQSTSSFGLDRAPGGGECAESMADRPFGPDVDAGATNLTSGEFTRLRIGMSRQDGEQEMKGVDISLPPGLTARLAGVPYCPEEAIESAREKSAAEEQQSRSCPASTWIGQVDLAAGTGPSPFELRGLAYFAGPYAGAPISMVVITPGMAGPYDLGTVVVRVALHVDPETLEVRALSDRIPHQLRGVGLGIRDIDVAIDRRHFSFNPTGCWEKYFTGHLWGGGGEPADHQRWSRSGDIMVGYQVEGCDRLGFEPRISTRLLGNRQHLRRSGHPALRAIVRTRPLESNIRRAAVRLPASVQLDQSSIRTVCTRDQYAGGECPRASIYGWAAARTPLLDEPVRGPVYLRSSDNVLPDLVASLRGQVNVELPGRIDSAGGRMRTSYTFVPDVPINAFALQLRGGPRGLVVANRNLCTRRHFVGSLYLGHNLKTERLPRTPLRMNCRPSRLG